MHIRIHTCIHIHIHIYISHTNTNMCRRIHTYIHIYMHTYIHSYIHAFAYICVLFVYAYTRCTYAHAFDLVVFVHSFTLCFSLSLSLSLSLSVCLSLSLSPSFSVASGPSQAVLRRQCRSNRSVYPGHQRWARKTRYNAPPTSTGPWNSTRYGRALFCGEHVFQILRDLPCIRALNEYGGPWSFSSCSVFSSI